ncbi:YhbP family protein [Paludibacterium yongneupense]|uniref:YhbP family protein n=1 Tax=Paludibacterium yongneupense TaxID=400061 RepID=UPI0003FDD92B|nr:YhbP family protein [Paludibacterium yongneupense]
MSRDDECSALHRFLTRQHVLTLCAMHEGELWCANAFYVFDADAMALDVMTSARTRHGVMMTENPRIAGTIARQTRAVDLIQGVQYRGDIRVLGTKQDTEARLRYCRRFPVARALSAPMWRIAMEEIKFTDNSQHFAHKTLWTRTDEFAAHGAQKPSSSRPG